MVRCTECDAEAVLRSRFNRHEFDSIDAAERRVLEVIQRPVATACASCSSTDLDGVGSRHVFLMYSERAEAHLAITLRMTREDDGRTKVLRQVWIVPTDSEVLEVEHEDGRLDEFWMDSRIRCRAVHPDPAVAAEELKRLAVDHPDDSFLLRELAHCLLDAGNTARALAAFELSLESDPDQPRTLGIAGRLYTSLGLPGRGAELLLGAWERTKEVEVLHSLLRAAYRGRRLGLLEQGAVELAEHEPGNVLAAKARALTRGFDDVGELRERWEELSAIASAAGDRETLHIAKYWCELLELPFPDWTPEMSAGDFVDALVGELDAMDVQIERRPDALEWGDAELPVDLEVINEQGEHLLFFMIEEVANPALRQRIAAIVRAAAHDERRIDCKIVPVWRQPLSWGSYQFASQSPTAEILVLADADTTMSVIDENVAAFLVSAERHFGRTLDFSVESLDEVDAILLRLHDRGFGEITYAFQCQVASYVGEVARSAFEDAAWDLGEHPMDPRVFRLSEDDELNLISKIGKVVRNGAEDSISHFLAVVREHVDA